MKPENISYIIKKIRKDNNLTQRDLADELNVTYQAVSKWENAKGIPDISTLKIISEKYHISLDNILDGNFIHKKKDKKKIIIIISSILLFLISIILIYFLVKEKNNEAYLLQLKTDCKDFSLNGILTNSGQKSAIHISNITYCGNEIDDTIYDEVKCNLYEVHSKDEKKLISVYNEKGEKKLQDYLKEISFNVNNYKRICGKFVDDTILLEINAIKENKTVTYNIPLIVEEDC